MEKKNKKKIIFGSLIGIVVIALAIVGGVVLYTTTTKKDTPKTETVVPEPKESAYRLSGNSLEDFDLRFLQLENEKVNKIYSPLSIKYALEMLGEGSVGNSKAQIDNIIGDYKAKKYTNSEHMSFANAMFIKNAYQDVVKKEYINKLSEKYNAEIIYDSFETANNLNSWVSNKTFQLVQDLFDNESIQDKSFILTNALAINMEWENIIQDWFDVNYPHEKFEMHIQPIDGGQYSSIKFNNNSTDVQAVEFGAAINKYDIVNELGEENIRQTVGKEYENWLATTGGCQNDPDTNTYLDTYINYLNSNYQKVDKSTDFLLYDDEEVKAFAKDLKEYNGTTLQYIGIMPKNISLDSYIEQMNSKELNTIITNLKEIKLENFKEGVVTKVIGYIPLFKFDYELDLINDLKELGITDIFDINKSDLSGMIDNTAVIDSVSHKANIEFSNEGIKAAAVTQLGGLGSTSCGFVYDYDVPVETIDLTFDNPYLFLIRDKNSGEIWFTGTVYNPLPTK